MAQQRVQKQHTVKRMDVAAAEQETAEHEEMLSKSRRASKRAQRASQHAATLVELIERVV